MKFKYLLLLVMINYGVICCASSKSFIPSPDQKAAMFSYLKNAATSNMGRPVYFDPIEGITTVEQLSMLQQACTEENPIQLRKLIQQTGFFVAEARLGSETGRIGIRALTEEQYNKSDLVSGRFESKSSVKKGTVSGITTAAVIIGSSSSGESLNGK